jgi:hypothetical protein
MPSIAGLRGTAIVLSHLKTGVIMGHSKTLTKSDFRPGMTVRNARSKNYGVVLGDREGRLLPSDQAFLMVRCFSSGRNRRVAWQVEHLQIWHGMIYFEDRVGLAIAEIRKAMLKNIPRDAGSVFSRRGCTEV